MNFIEKWRKAQEEKKSLLCVNIDPAEFDQRPKLRIDKGMSKLEWCKRIVSEVAPYAAAIKPNRQYFKDFSRSQMLELNQLIGSLGMISIDDSKIADIGDTNDAALYHAICEGFDAITYAPFPGNIGPTCEMATKRNIGLIPLALMSNPEFKMVKSIPIEGEPAYLYYARQAAKYKAQGIVVGAPSPKNHISISELNAIREVIGDMTILVPGIGAQGGDLGPVVRCFGKNAIISVGRDIAYHKSPAQQAQYYRDLIRGQLHKLI